MLRPHVTGFLHEPSASISYIVHAEGERDCAVIDPVLDFDPRAIRTSVEFADELIRHVRERGLTVSWILETHAHADRLSAAAYVKSHVGGKIAISSRIGEVQKTWNGILNLAGSQLLDEAAFDKLLTDGDTLDLGSARVKVMHTPGHTPADATYLVGDAAFIGDTMFMPDYGTARADFPGGSAADLYRSIQRILALPPDTRLFLCHDYLTATRSEHRWETSVRSQREQNIHLKPGISEEAFVEFREARDRTLSLPALLLFAIQFNLRGGEAPPREENGVSYLKVPLNRF